QADPDRPTGTVGVSVDAAGQPSYTITPDVAWDFIGWTPDLGRLAASARAVCFGTLAQRSPASRATIQRFLREAGRRPVIVYDVNLRQHFYDRETIEASMRQSHWLKLNDQELPVLSEMLGLTAASPSALLAELRGRFGLSLVCLTRGEHGCLVQ